jgi:hypothetical protein
MPIYQVAMTAVCVVCVEAIDAEEAEELALEADSGDYVFQSQDEPERIKGEGNIERARRLADLVLPRSSCGV